LPTAIYIAKGNYFWWGKQIETADGTNAGIYDQVSDITFNPDATRISAALDRNGLYTSTFMIVIFNKDGSVYGSFKESTGLRGKIRNGGHFFDSTNLITAAVDVS
jgi:hypothetical protein